MAAILSGISIVPYSSAYRQGCIAAFESNTPKFFTLEEVNQYADWLQFVEGLPDTEQGEEKTHYFVVQYNDLVIGCGGFGYTASTHQAILAWGLVHHQYHHQQIGSALLNFRLNLIAALYPLANLRLDTNQHSYTFFERHGFVVEEFTKDYYAPGMHRYDMKWQKK